MQKPNTAVPVAIITGTIGAGKSTVAALASEVLHNLGIKHGLLEVDWLEGVYPPADPNDPHSTAFSMKNLQAIWPNFLDAGISRAIATMTLESHDELHSLLRALGHPDSTVVVLEASQASCEARIKSREHGDLRDLFLRKTGEIAETMRRMEIGDVVILNEDRDPVETAKDVLKNLGWI